MLRLLPAAALFVGLVAPSALSVTAAQSPCMPAVHSKPAMTVRFFLLPLMLRSYPLSRIPNGTMLPGVHSSVIASTHSKVAQSKVLVAVQAYGADMQIGIAILTLSPSAWPKEDYVSYLRLIAEATRNSGSPASSPSGSEAVPHRFAAREEAMVNAGYPMISIQTFIAPVGVIARTRRAKGPASYWTDHPMGFRGVSMLLLSDGLISVSMLLRLATSKIATQNALWVLLVPQLAEVVNLTARLEAIMACPDDDIASGPTCSPLPEGTAMPCSTNLAGAVSDVKKSVSAQGTRNCRSETYIYMHISTPGRISPTALACNSSQSASSFASAPSAPLPQRLSTAHVMCGRLPHAQLRQHHERQLWCTCPFCVRIPIPADICRCYTQPSARAPPSERSVLIHPEVLQHAQQSVAQQEAPAGCCGCQCLSAGLLGLCRVIMPHPKHAADERLKEPREQQHKRFIRFWPLLGRHCGVHPQQLLGSCPAAVGICCASLSFPRHGGAAQRRNWRTNRARRQPQDHTSAQTWLAAR